MHLLGGSFESCFFGSSIIGRKQDSGFAWLLNGEQVVFIDAQRRGVIISPQDHVSFFEYSLPDKLSPLSEGRQTQHLRESAMSILQAADTVFKNQSHNIQPRPSSSMRQVQEISQ
jgi:hypothetical protein